MVERENEGSGPRRSSVVGMDEGDSAVALEGESAMKAIFLTLMTGARPYPQESRMELLFCMKWPFLV